MSGISKLNNDVSVCGALEAHDFSDIAALGYKTIINMRPDDEKFGQLNAAEARAYADAAGMNYVHIPVPVNGLTEDMVDSFTKAVAENPGPYLTHCASGRRAAIVWALHAAGMEDTDHIINCCLQAGHPLQQLRPMIAGRAATKA